MIFMVQMGPPVIVAIDGDTRKVTTLQMADYDDLAFANWEESRGYRQPRIGQGEIFTDPEWLNPFVNAWEAAGPTVTPLPEVPVKTPKVERWAPGPYEETP